MAIAIDAAALQGLLDREAIRAAMYGYCRGIDRADEALLRAVYWPDATDRHGPYQGSANGFIEWAMEKLGSAGRGVHFIGNILIELHGDIAAVETYFQAKQEAPAASGIVQRLQLFGRYADRFEKREGQWRVAARVVIYDAFEEEIVPVQTDLERFGAARQPLGARGQDDPMYALLAEVRKQGGVASAAVLQTTESTRKPSK